MDVPDDPVAEVQLVDLAVVLNECGDGQLAELVSLEMSRNLTLSGQLLASNRRLGLLLDEQRRRWHADDARDRERRRLSVMVDEAPG